MHPEELRNLINQGESDTLELKASVPRPEQIARDMASFANTKGGHIVFGVQEPINIVGVDVARIQRAFDFALTKVDPKPNVSLDTVVLDRRSMVVVSIKRSAALVSAYGGYYHRISDTTRALSAEEIRTRVFSESTLEKAVSDLSALAAKQTQTIDNLQDCIVSLRDESASANSMPKKFSIAAVSAVLGALAKYLVDVFLL